MSGGTSSSRTLREPPLGLPDLHCVMLHAHISRRGQDAGVDAGAVRGTFVVVALVVLGVVLLAYTVYFFFFKKM
jgi:hypothetical protein